MTKFEDIKKTTPPKIAWILGFEEGIKHMNEVIDKYKPIMKKNSQKVATEEYNTFLKETKGLI